MNLYISDLDGTLLNERALLSEYSKKTLNKVLESDVNFSIATARTPATVIPILEGLNLKLPIVVMNGAAMYDINKDQYLNENYIQSNLAKKITNVIESCDVAFFTYKLSNNHIYAYYEKSNELQDEFIKTRTGSPYKTFVKGQVPNFDEVLYFFIRDKKESVLEVYENLKNISDLYCVLYKDVYKSDIYNLEIYSNKSSKANSIKLIMEDNNFDKLVAFGDNLNDLPMFDLADEGLAVDNAVIELKDIASGVIESNIDNGVAKYLASVI